MTPALLQRARSRSFAPPPTTSRPIAPTMHRAALERHYNAAFTTIGRWLRDTGATPGGAAAELRLRSAPPIFAEQAPRLTRGQLMYRFNCSDNLLRRWCKECGVQPKPSFHRNKSGLGFGVQSSPPSDLASQAAQHLRRFHSNVYNCEILPIGERKHLPDKGKGMWSIAGVGAVSAEKLIELAEAKGFDRAAWARI